VPTHQGWQFIHAYCVAEAMPRTFSNAIEDDSKTIGAIESFRESMIAKTGEEWEHTFQGTLKV
jgi:hypothetical protein